MKIIAILIIIFFLYYVFKLGFSVIRMFLSALFGIETVPRNTSSTQQKKKQTTKQSTPAPPKKIITRDEGEYVDFEEIKD